MAKFTTQVFKNCIVCWW